MDIEGNTSNDAPICSAFFLQPQRGLGQYIEQDCLAQGISPTLKLVRQLNANGRDSHSAIRGKY